MSKHPIWRDENDEIHEILPDMISVQSMSSGTVSLISALEPMRGEFRILSSAKKVQHPAGNLKEIKEISMPRPTDRSRKPAACDKKMFRDYKKLKKAAEKNYRSVEVFSLNKPNSAEVIDIVTSVMDEFMKTSGGKNAMRIDLFRNMNSEINMVKIDGIRELYGSVTRDSLEKSLNSPRIPEDALLKLECKKLARDLKAQKKEKEIPIRKVWKVGCPVM